MRNSLKLNASKTQLIVLGTRQMLRSLSPISLSVNGSTIHESDRVKNLGLVMDHTLSYEPHIGQLVGRCTGLLIGLSHARHRQPKETLITIINALVLSTLRYCIGVYGTATAKNMTRFKKSSILLLGLSRARGGENMTISVTHSAPLCGFPHVNWSLITPYAFSSAYWLQVPLMPLPSSSPL